MENARRKLAKSLGEASIQKLRLSKGFSQAKLAELIGSTQSQIAKIEAQQIALYGETLKKLADALDVPMETIYHLTKKQVSSTLKT